MPLTDTYIWRSPFGRRRRERMGLSVILALPRLLEAGVKPEQFDDWFDGPELEFLHEALGARYP